MAKLSRVEKEEEGKREGGRGREEEGVDINLRSACINLRLVCAFA